MSNHQQRPHNQRRADLSTLGAGICLLLITALAPLGYAAGAAGQKDSTIMATQTTDTDWQQWLERMKAPAAPARIDHPFQVVGELDEASEIGGRPITIRSYDLKVPFMDANGRVVSGKARLMMPPHVKAPTPVVVAMHYGMGASGAGEYFAEGWPVLSPMQPNDLYRESMNFNMALVQAARAMPWVDGKRIALTGGSAGGYITLMTASEMFPIVAAVPHVPLINLAYNGAYITRNMGPAECGKTDAEGKDASLVPVLCFIAEGITASGLAMGDVSREGANWLANSPIGVLDLITCPVQMDSSTADTLVPIQQIGPDLAYPMPESFPKGFTFDMDKLLPDPATRITFLQTLRPERAEVFRVTSPLTPQPASAGAPAPSPATKLVFPFSKTADFSVIILDEGPPDPKIGHLKYGGVWTAAVFMKYWMDQPAPIAARQLTAAKLEMLMRRFLNENFEGVKNFRGGSGNEITLMHRRNRRSRERLDVILGLRAYCDADPAYAARLSQLYSRLAPELRVLDAGKGGRAARFQDDVTGGLTYHEAMLHYRWGDRARAAQMAKSLIAAKGHEAYAACLPEALRAGE